MGFRLTINVWARLYWDKIGYEHAMYGTIPNRGVALAFPQVKESQCARAEIFGTVEFAFACLLR